MLVKNPGTKYMPLPVPRPRPADDGCAQPCPECGGLQCLCRPRFFAGQLLTEDDLNRLDRYIVEKNKLHNRYLHGWGVVCGLEVVCHPCDDAVIVRPGYALSPCGEDIIVCDQTVVPVCDLIKACQDQQRSQWECEPYPYGPADDCNDRCKEWVLTIRYDEKPSRGMAALGGQNGCCSKCGGSGKSCGCNGNCNGGPGSGGCGCGGKTNGTSMGNSATRTGSMTTSKRTLQQCEPTTTCEGFVFEMCPYKPSYEGSGDLSWYRYPGLQQLQSSKNLKMSQSLSLSKLSLLGVDGLSDCLAEITAAMPPTPGKDATPEEYYAWCCDTKQALRDYLQTHPTYDCRLDEKIAAMPCPLPSGQMTVSQKKNYIGQIETSHSALLDIGRAFLDYCKCSMLLPPCPDPVDDPRVPLAIITICDGCKVMRVCNLDVRKYVITFPLIEHYLQGLGLGNWFRRRLTAMCCPPDEIKRVPEQPAPVEPTPVEPAPVQPAPIDMLGNIEKRVIGGWVAKPVRRVQYARTPETRVRNLSRLALSGLARPERSLDTFSLLAGAMGAVDDNGMPLASNLEIDNPLQALLVNALVTPLLKDLIPSEFAGATQTIASTVDSGREGEDQQAAITRMQSELEVLRKTATDQQASIALLLEQLKGMKKE